MLRKFTSTECNMNIFNKLLFTSDPYLNLIRSKVSRKKQVFSKQALDLLLLGGDDSDP